jgi:hypothetical protein
MIEGIVRLHLLVLFNLILILIWYEDNHLDIFL